jgi:hypothetical protein
MLRLFTPEGALVSRSDPILGEPIQWAASISPEVRKKVLRHVTGAEYHVGRWHRPPSLSFPLAEGVVNEFDQRAVHIKLIPAVLIPRSEPWQPRIIAFDSSLPNFAPTRLGNNV